MMMPQMQQHGMMPGQAGMGLKGQSGPLMGQQQPGRVNNSYDMREDYKKVRGSINLYISQYFDNKDE